MNVGSVFENNRTQAVRLPSGTRFPKEVKKVAVRVIGKARILEPVDSSWDRFFHPTEEGVTDDFMSERSAQHQQERESL